MKDTKEYLLARCAGSTMISNDDYEKLVSTMDHPVRVMSDVISRTLDAEIQLALSSVGEFINPFMSEGRKRIRECGQVEVHKDSWSLEYVFKWNKETMFALCCDYKNMKITTQRFWRKPE